MPWTDVLRSAAGFAKDITLLKDRFDRQEKELEKQRDAIAALREENAKLTARVAVLEEGRKTVAAEVKAALTEALATWQIQQKDQEIANLKRKRIPASDDQ